MLRAAYVGTSVHSRSQRLVTVFLVLKQHHPVFTTEEKYSQGQA